MVSLLPKLQTNVMKTTGVIPIEKLEGKCATCRHYKPLVKIIYGIETKFARGSCSISFYKSSGMVYKQRTETCKRWEKYD